MARTPNILVVGSVNMDLAVRCPHMPQPGQTVLGDGFSASPGGKGANQAVAAARLGAACQMIGRVGDDAFGQTLRARLRDAGVGVDAVAVTPGKPSGVAMVVVDGKGENAIVVASGANWRVTPDDIFGHADLFAAADVVILQLELPCETVMAAMSKARRHNCLVVLDPAPARADLPAELLQADWLTPNASEAETLTGQSMPNMRAAKTVATELIARGARGVVLKLGSAGSLAICHDLHIHHAPAFRVDAIDTTAAGDAFTAALAVALGRGEPVVKAARYANAAGALAASRLGAQAAMPTAAEVKMLMDDQPL